MKWLKEYTVARVDEPASYENSGVIAQVHDGKAIIWTFGHCSCNGTWPESDYTGKDWVEWTDKGDWEGTPDQLVEIAKNKSDIFVSGRAINRDDYDAKRWETFYRLVLAWDAAGRPEQAFQEDVAT